MTYVRFFRAGERVSLPVRELDGALTGWRMRPAPCDGYHVEEGDMSIFVPAEDFENARSRRRRK